MISEKTAKKLETDIEWNGRANVCVHCGKVPETFYVATGHDHTDYDIRWCPCREPNHNWCAGCSPDNCSGCGADSVEIEQLKAALRGALNEARDFESDVDTIAQHNVELQLEIITLKSALKVVSALLHEYKMGNACKNKFVEEAITTIEGVLKHD